MGAQVGGVARGSDSALWWLPLLQSYHEAAKPLKMSSCLSQRDLKTLPLADYECGSTGK